MNEPINVLLQTTIVPQDNDWHIARFSMLRDYLASLAETDGRPLYRVAARDRGPVNTPDPVLSTLDRSAYDELWLFAVDEGDGLHPADRAGILGFRARGGGLMITRDHMDLGCSIGELGPVGAPIDFTRTTSRVPFRRRMTAARLTSAGPISTRARTGISSEYKPNYRCTPSCATTSPKPAP